jgi:hypothetical protein
MKTPWAASKKNDALQNLPQYIEELAAHTYSIRNNASFSFSSFGFSSIDVRRLAYKMSERSRNSHSFNQYSKLAGKRLFDYFMKEHSNLSVRQPENTSITRSKGLNRHAVNSIFFTF